MYLVVYIIGRINPKKKVTFAQDFVVKGFRIVLKLSGTVLNVEGQELVPEDTPVLYVANHKSYYDIVTCYTLVAAGVRLRIRASVWASTGCCSS